jgi:hypothetical protein
MAIKYVSHMHPSVSNADAFDGNLITHKPFTLFITNDYVFNIVKIGHYYQKKNVLNFIFQPAWPAMSLYVEV